MSVNELERFRANAACASAMRALWTRSHQSVSILNDLILINLPATASTSEVKRLVVGK